MVRVSPRWAAVAAALALLQPQQFFLSVTAAESATTKEETETNSLRGASETAESSVGEGAAIGNSEEEFAASDVASAETETEPAQEFPPWDPFSGEFGALMGDLRRMMEAFVGTSREGDAAGGAPAFGAFGQSRTHPMASPFGSFSFEGMGEAGASPILMKLPSGDENKELCRVYIEAKENVAVVLDADTRRLQADFRRNRNQQKKGDKWVSSFWSSVSSSSSIALPPFCLTNTAVLLSGYAGMVVKPAATGEKSGESTEDSGFKAVVIFPSIPQITKLVKAGGLPADTIDALRSGSTMRLDQLPPQQQCLAAGFSGTECSVLGKKPPVKEMEQFDVTSSIPMPEYEAEYSLMQKL